jgi:hypothetical protein
MTPTEQVLAALASHGLLLKQDKAIPSVVGILTGESLSTSWWSHPKGRLIFAVLTELADHPDVLFTKLLYRKDTLVHRSLWPALLAVARSREPWQLRNLSVSAKGLLERLDGGENPVRASGAAVKELEARLLAVAREVHTESGRHEMILEPWDVWAARVRCKPLRSVSNARKVIEDAATVLGATRKSLPWPDATVPGSKPGRTR